MILDLCDIQSLAQIAVENALDQVPHFRGNFVRYLVVAHHHFFEELAQNVIFEGEVPADQTVKDYSTSPNVGHLCGVVPFFEDFGVCVPDCSSEGVHEAATLHEGGEAEVGYFDLVLFGDENILELDVPMGGAFEMGMLQSKD